MSIETKFLSIIICSRNRAHEIVNCLPPLAEQARQFGDVEVIVVDNGSTDNTKQVVEEAKKKTSYPFRYVLESIPGLCQARNRGRDEAEGKVLAYIDDDAIVKPGWIGLIRQHFMDGKSDCLGGKVSIELGGEMPFRLEKDMEWFFMASQLGDSPRMLSYPQHPTGCNMSFTTRVFDEIGGFNTNLKLYGDEKDFFRRVAEKKFSVYYDPGVEVYQFIPGERLTKKELKEKSFKWGEGAAMNWMLEQGSSVKRAGKVFEFSLRTIYMSIMSKVRGNFGGFYTYWYNRGYLKNLLKGVESKKRNGG